VHAPGADNPALYVALSRHRDRAVVFGSRAELESPQQEYLAGGPPSTDIDRLRRVAEQLAERAAVSQFSADDRPVLDDLGQAPRRAQPHHAGSGRESRERARRGAARAAPRRVTERVRKTWQPPAPVDDRQPGPDRRHSEPEPQPGRNGRSEFPPPTRDRGLER
jgi:hypothetical protein